MRPRPAPGRAARPGRAPGLGPGVAPCYTRTGRSPVIVTLSPFNGPGAWSPCSGILLAGAGPGGNLKFRGNSTLVTVD
jgi:hypothetical protein